MPQVAAGEPAGGGSQTHLPPRLSVVLVQAEGVVAFSHSGSWQTLPLQIVASTSMHVSDGSRPRARLFATANAFEVVLPT